MNFQSPHRRTTSSAAGAACCDGTPRETGAAAPVGCSGGLGAASPDPRIAAAVQDRKHLDPVGQHAVVHEVREPPQFRRPHAAERRGVQLRGRLDAREQLLDRPAKVSPRPADWRSYQSRALTRSPWASGRRTTGRLTVAPASGP
jgi:hypothetical protein